MELFEGLLGSTKYTRHFTYLCIWFWNKRQNLVTSNQVEESTKGNLCVTNYLYNIRPS